MSQKLIFAKIYLVKTRNMVSDISYHIFVKAYAHFCSTYKKISFDCPEGNNLPMNFVTSIFFRKNFSSILFTALVQTTSVWKTVHYNVLFTFWHLNESISFDYLHLNELILFDFLNVLFLIKMFIFLFIVKLFLWNLIKIKILSY